MEKKLSITLPFMIIVNVVFVILSVFPITLLHLMVPVCIIMILAGFVFPILLSETLGCFNDYAASANGILFALIWSFYSVFSFIGAKIYSYSALPVACVYLCFAVISYLWFLVFFKNK